MFRAEIEALEAHYQVMGEALLGSVRPLPVQGWHWLFEESRCVYYRDRATGIGIHSVFTEQPDGGLEGKQYYFSPDEILYAFDVALSEKERTQQGLGRYLLCLHQFDFDFNPERTIKIADQQLFWDSLRAPTRDL